MTKKLTFKIKGKPGDDGWAVGESIYVRYYKDDFKANFKKLFPNDPILEDKIDKHTDFKYFLTKHEVKCIWLGRGIDLDKFYHSIEVFENDKPVKLSSDKIYEISESNIGSNSYDDALKEYHALENIDLNYIIRARFVEESFAKEIFNTSEFFKNTNNYKFADISTIYCKEVTAHTTIEVEDNYSFRDFNINIGEIDTDAVPFWIYEKTNLEFPIYSIDYKGKKYNLNFDVKSGGTGERTFYERKKNKDKESQSWKEWEWDRMAMVEHAWDLPSLLKIKKQSW